MVYNGLRVQRTTLQKYFQERVPDMWFRKQSLRDHHVQTRQGGAVEMSNEIRGARQQRRSGFVHDERLSGPRGRANSAISTKYYGQ